MPMVNSNRDEPTELPQPFAPGDPIIYTYIFAGENSDAVTCTYAHEKIRLDFFAPSHYMYCILLGKM